MSISDQSIFPQEYELSQLEEEHIGMATWSKPELFFWMQSLHTANLHFIWADLRAALFGSDSATPGADAAAGLRCARGRVALWMYKQQLK